MTEEYDGVFRCCIGCGQYSTCDPEYCGKVEAEIMMEQLDEYYETVMDTVISEAESEYERDEQIYAERETQASLRRKHLREI